MKRFACVAGLTVAKTLTRTYGFAAAMEFSKANRHLRVLFVNLRIWNVVVKSNHVPNRKGDKLWSPFARVTRSLLESGKVLCGACFSLVKNPAFVAIDRSRCPVCTRESMHAAGGAN